MSIFEVTATQSKSSGTDYAPCPAGSHPAILVALIDLGTHTQEYDNGDKDIRKVLLVFDVFATHESGETSHHVMTKDFNLLFGEKAGLRQFMESWRGKKYEPGEKIDLSKTLGQKGFVTVTNHQSAKGKEYAKLAAIGPVPAIAKAAVKDLKPVNIPWTWSIEDGDFPPHDWIPYLYGEPVQNVIARSHEKAGKPKATEPVSGRQPGVNYDQAPAADKPDDEIPF